MRITIPNWEKYQHYKDRNPPWIKLHKNLINDPNNHRRWVETSPDACKLLIELWLLASDSGGVLNHASSDLAFRLHRKGNCDKLLKELEDKGWIELASTVLAECLQGATSETETETETETDISCPSGKPDARKSAIPFDEFWELYPRKENKARAQKAWVNLTIANQKAAMAALPNHVAAWGDRAMKFIPLPTTWLNGERWLDEVAAPTREHQVGEQGPENLGPWYPDVKYWEHPWHPEDDEFEAHADWHDYNNEMMKSFGLSKRWTRFGNWLEERTERKEQEENGW